MSTMQPATSCLHGITRICAGAAFAADPPRRHSRVQEQHAPTRQEKRALLPLHDKSAGKARTFPINTPPSVRADVTDELLRNGP